MFTVRTSLKYQRGITKRDDFIHKITIMRQNHKETTQKLIDAYRIHYNIIRNRIGIGRTPAEQAGIKLDLGQNKIENLIKLASKSNFKMNTR